MLEKLRKPLRDSWLILGISIVLFCLLEGGLSLLYFIQDRRSGADQPTVDHHVNADGYPDSSWLTSYWKEFADSKPVEWRSYVYWRRMPYRGVHINVDTDGIRSTTRPNAGDRRPRGSAKVFMFGGSTMWGTGARDAFTIPSILSRELEGSGVAAEVTNFGEAGYVSTQEVIALMLRLQGGDVPDLVIFYDGLNDTFSAYQQHVAGAPQNEFNRFKEFNLSRPDRFKERRAMALREFTEGLSTVRFVRSHLWRRTAPSRETPETNPFLVAENTPLDIDGLARGVLDKYVGNVEIVEALSDHYGFECLFYWQPTIFEKASLTRYENEQKEKVTGKMKELERFFTETYAVVRHGQLAANDDHAFRDLSSIFADWKEPVYVDWSHLSELGNETIARSMATDALGAITGPKSAAPSGARHEVLR